jgi:site-specific DNA-methyltransferase (adenine-specific)
MVELYNGDCLEEMKNISDESVDMVMADLPYGMTACKWDSIIPLEPMWKEFKRITKPNSAMVFTSVQPFTTTLGYSNIKNLKCEWIWEKPQGTNPMNAKIMPLRSHENILVFYENPPIYNPQMWYSTPYSGYESEKSRLGKVYGSAKYKHRDNPDGSRYPKTVLRHKQVRRGLHPTQKPLDLIEYFILTYTNEQCVVFDPTMGSGTTGVACLDTNRDFIGIELDEEYYSISKYRIENHNPLENFEI